MRILVCSDLYPPASLGGYEVAAGEVTQALRERGHEIRVLTTDYRAETTETRPDVARILRWRLGGRWTPFSLPRAAAWERADIRSTLDVLAAFRPDVIFLWNVGTLTHGVLDTLLRGAVPAVVYVFGDWPLRKHRAPHDLDYWASVFARRPEAPWRGTARAAYRQLARALGMRTRAAPLRFDHFEFGSRFMMDLFHRAGLAGARSERLIYYGLFGAFARAATAPVSEQPAAMARTERGPAERAETFRLLFVGRLWEAKGVHTAVEALGALRRRGGTDWALTVAGPAEHTAYLATLKDRARELGVADRIRWAGQVPREGLLDLYASHDCLVFPSIYEEPFGIVQLEAMAAGCAVVGTGTGGSAEILQAGENALCFNAGDATSLADQVTHLRADPALARRLREGGKRTVRTRFMGKRMVDEVEAHLAEVASRSGR